MEYAASNSGLISFGDSRSNYRRLVDGYYNVDIALTGRLHLKITNMTCIVVVNHLNPVQK